MSYYWSAESWGSDYPPADWERIVEGANYILDMFAEREPEKDLNVISENLWDSYCMNGHLPTYVGASLWKYGRGGKSVFKSTVENG